MITDRTAERGYTEGTMRALKERPGLGFEEKPWRGGEQSEYRGKRIIARDTPINGRTYVCVSEDGRGGEIVEATMVDDKSDEELDKAYKLLQNRLETKNTDEKKRVGELVRVVNQTTKDLLPNSDHNQILAEFADKLSDGDLVPLGKYIEKGLGLDRHRALLAGYLLERLKRDKYIRPWGISIDKNYVPGKGGHAWVRYLNSAAEVFVIDPMFGFAGGLDDLNRPNWPYERDEDKKTAGVVVKQPTGQ